MSVPKGRYNNLQMSGFYLAYYCAGNSAGGDTWSPQVSIDKKVSGKVGMDLHMPVSRYSRKWPLTLLGVMIETFSLFLSSSKWTPKRKSHCWPLNLISII